MHFRKVVSTWNCYGAENTKTGLPFQVLLTKVFSDKKNIDWADYFAIWAADWHLDPCQIASTGWGLAWRQV